MNCLLSPQLNFAHSQDPGGFFQINPVGAAAAVPTCRCGQQEDTDTYTQTTSDTINIASHKLTQCLFQHLHKQQLLSHKQVQIVKACSPPHTWIGSELVSENRYSHPHSLDSKHVTLLILSPAQTSGISSCRLYTPEHPQSSLEIRCEVLPWFYDV